MKEMQNLLKLISDGLKTLAQGVEAIADKVDEAAKNKGGGRVKSKKRPAPVKTVKTDSPKKAPLDQKTAPKVVQNKAAKSMTAIDTVLNIIGRSKNGVKTAAIMAKTGYDQKKVSNIIYKLKKQGKIKTIQKGVYLKI